MYRELLNKKHPEIRLNAEGDFITLMTEVDEETVITNVNPTHVFRMEKDGSYPMTIQNDNWNEGDFFLGTEDGSGQPLINSAIDSVIARADLHCRLISELFNRGKVEAEVLLNEGLAFKQNLRNEDKANGKEVAPCQMVTRGGWVIGAMSNQWAHIPQKELAETCLREIRNSFPDAKFESVLYTHEFTEFWVSLGDHSSDIMKKYRNGWIASGYDEKDLENVKPLIRICTSDTGQSGVVVTPILQNRRFNHVLGERLATKHAGKNSMEDVIKDLHQSFAKAQESLDKVATLMSTPIYNPVPVMVRALEYGKKSLWSMSHGACEDILEDFAFMYRGVPGVSAYDIYAAISEMEYCDKVKNLKQNAAIQIVEAIYRLIDIDWKALDCPGKEYLGDGIKKNGGRP